MRRFSGRNRMSQWARFAMKMGLVLTDPKAWENVNEQLRERVEDAGDTLRERYEDATDRLRDARSALRGETHWATPTMAFVGGLAVGAGLGILFAPVSGEEARATIRDKVVDAKNRVSDIAGTYVRSSATGTEGD
jgi:gas vesicle protein